MFSEVDSTGHSQEGRLAPALLLSALLILIFSAAALSQDLPNSIRGYKVYKDKISVSARPVESSSSDASVKIGDPELVEAALTGVTFELPAEVLSEKQSGKVDFLSFLDVRVNGVSVEVEEYRHPFAFKKGVPMSLPKPARISFPATSMLKAAWNEMLDSKEEWAVSGRIFVFGRFRRLGMYHKRVVPVDFQIKIRNPLLNN